MACERLPGGLGAPGHPGGLGLPNLAYGARVRAARRAARVGLAGPPQVGPRGCPGRACGPHSGWCLRGGTLRGPRARTPVRSAVVRGTRLRASQVPRVPCRFLLRDSRGGKVSAPRPGSGSRRPGVGPDHNGEGCGRPLIGYEQQCISRPVPDDPMFIGGYTDQGRCRAGCGAGGKASRTAGKECSLLSDLAALTPPAVVCVAFLIGVGLFLRHQLGPKRESAEDEYPEDISGDSGIPHRDGSQSDASEPAASPDRGER